MSASAERMATQNSEHSTVASLQDSILPHRLDEVLTACGRVAAILPQPGTDEQLIAANQFNNCPFAKPFDDEDSRIHCLGFCNRRRARGSSDRSD